MRFKALVAGAVLCFAGAPASAATYLSSLEPANPTALIGTAGYQTVIARVVFDRPVTGYLDWRASYNRIDCVKATGYCDTIINHAESGGLKRFTDAKVVYYKLDGYNRRYSPKTIKYQFLNGPVTLGVSDLTSPLGYSASLSFFGVPEPSTWALMILGVGATGIALRRRRHINSRQIPKPA